jgi:hypothetical protein
MSRLIRLIIAVFVCVEVTMPVYLSAVSLSYPVVDTGQNCSFDRLGEIPAPSPGMPFFGQDAQYQGLVPTYKDNGDGTVTDLATGLMWQKTPGPKLTWDEAMASVGQFNRERLGGYSDWRLPNIKELYSLILFIGSDPRPDLASSESNVPYLDRSVFDFSYGDPSKGERIIDAQYWSSTRYVSRTMQGQRTAFGVNFADGRIKGYGLEGSPDSSGRRHGKTAFVRYVRGATGYGVNHFVDNGDGTISDTATGLMWTKDDSGKGLDWEQALRFAQKNKTSGYTDWRLPNAKELQSIVDYTRSPDTSRSAAIDPLFATTEIKNEAGQADYPYYWSSTTHSNPPGRCDTAVYIAFGRAPGYMGFPPGNRENLKFMDVHGAGAQRSDPKAGDPANFPKGRGPQGDVIRIYNFVRCVRGGTSAINPATSGNRSDASASQGN